MKGTIIDKFTSLADQKIHDDDEWQIDGVQPIFTWEQLLSFTDEKWLIIIVSVPEK